MAFLRFDGKRVPVRPGDTIASALHRAEIRAISRSMKYHRPRGIFCNAGSCAGCFVDVDGVPNVPACMTDAADGQRVESQNTMGSAKRDLLAITDKVYRGGFDPHAAFTGTKVVNRVFLKAVRFMSGIGKVPDGAAASPATFTRMHVDVLVVGAGRHGLAAARDARGAVLLVDELPALGGSALWRREPETRDLAEEVAASSVEIWLGAVAFGVYDDTVAIVRDGDLYAVRPQRIVVAPGRHDAWPLFCNNDLPGVLSLRGAQRLLAQGVLPGKRIAAHGTPLPQDFLDALAAAGGAVVAGGEVSAAQGGTAVEKACVDGRWVRCDAIVCHEPGTPRIELFQQAGCELGFVDGVLCPRVDKDGRTTRRDVHWAGGTR